MGCMPAGRSLHSPRHTRTAPGQALNSQLPLDIWCTASAEVTDTFHPRTMPGCAHTGTIMPSRSAICRSWKRRPGSSLANITFRIWPGWATGTRGERSSGSGSGARGGLRILKSPPKVFSGTRFGAWRRRSSLSGTASWMQTGSGCCSTRRRACRSSRTGRRARPLGYGLRALVGAHRKKRPQRHVLRRAPAPPCAHGAGVPGAANREIQKQDRDLRKKADSSVNLFLRKRSSWAAPPPRGHPPVAMILYYLYKENCSEGRIREYW